MTFFLLFVTSVSNYITGRDLFLSADLGPTFEAIKDAGWGGLATIVYAGTIPTLLYVFLSMAVQRAEDITRSYRQSESLRAVAPIREAVDTFMSIRGALSSLPTFDAQPQPRESGQPEPKLLSSGLSPSMPGRVSALNSRHRRRAARVTRGAGPIQRMRGRVADLVSRRERADLDDEMTNERLTQMFEEWTGFCPVCSKTALPTVDHIVPLSKGGKHVFSNVRLVCLSCNSSKGNTQGPDMAPLRDQVMGVLDANPEGIAFVSLRLALGRDATADRHLRTILKAMRGDGEVVISKTSDSKGMWIKKAASNG
jgi:5-methylcytosine-specific restriction endonuclease McrA